MAAAGGRPASHFSTTRVADEMAHASSRPMWIQRQGVSPRDSVSPPLAPEADAGRLVAKA